ncbi:hypothetical protein BGX27_006065 [Mortierella sp. AM989]|nr:hypothetical protein BGX27_006065 [Mortierella sp. AM989]
MRFHTIIAVAVAVIATASAQTTPEMPAKECLDCVTKNMMAVSVCKGVRYDPSADPTKVDDATKKCVCTLAQNLSWLKSCEGPTTCTASSISLIESSYDMIKTNMCAGVDTSSAVGGKSAGCTLSIPKAGAALAIAAAAAQALF